MKLIAETDFKLKNVRFFTSGDSVANMYPNKNRGSIATGVYRYLKGEIKNLNNKHYFTVDVDYLDNESIKTLTERARDIARAQIENKSK